MSDGAALAPHLLPTPALSPATSGRLGLYIHIPFCAQKCPYCDFNTYAGLEKQIGATVDALCREMARWRATVAGRPIDTIFFGGGTPTLLTAEQLTQLFTAIQRNFALTPGCEISSEANPGTVDRAKFELLRALGVNRLSLGVQSFQPEELTFLGRIHDVNDVFKAFEAARAAGFTNINLDFIFGLPGQPLEKWGKTLAAALRLGPEHLSLYSLIVEPNTPLHHWVATGKVAGPDEDLAATQYEYAMEQLAAAGYLHYEISNWAKATPADVHLQAPTLTADAEQTPALAAQHNLIYWRNQEYLGIGPGAHSHLWFSAANGQVGRRRWGNRKPVPGYVKRIDGGDAVEEFCEESDARGAMGETMMLGLRLLREGVPFQRFAAMHQVDLREVFAKPIAQLQGWGLIELDPVRIRLSPRGVLLGNQVFTYFLPD
ncbi:MAG: radical SAM family heme chaperone HemW [Caldilinea sp. CFX5]|nr:radical SAM family heme chaperone HemW [Caldilinea sp. CFX5]